MSSLCDRSLRPTYSAERAKVSNLPTNCVLSALKDAHAGLLRY